MTLSPDERTRYGRHILIPEFGEAGQARLKASSVLIVGAGGLGCPAALYLAAAGVGRIGIVDFDVIDDSNLQRQVLYTTADVGKPKLAQAKARLLALNPHITIDEHAVRLSSENALDLVSGYDVVIDGTDNFPTRYLINDACVLAGKPNVYGSIFRFEGQISLFNHDGGPCYRCLYPQPPPHNSVPNCAEAGVLGVLPGVVGSLQATEAIKVLVGIGETLSGRLVLYDALDLRFEEIRIKRNPACVVCGANPSITQLIDYEAFCGIGPASPGAVPDVTAAELEVQRRSGAPLTVLDVREPGEIAICAIPGSIRIPLGQLENRLHEVPAGPIVVHCKTGARSEQATRILLGHGWDAVNLAGGIIAWLNAADPTQPTY